MAQTIGLVQRLKVTSPPILAWVYIGPAPNDTDVLVILQPNGLGPEDAAFRASMVDALSAALVTQREVIATHNNNDVELLAVELRAP
jgi:hypothetical protein